MPATRDPAQRRQLANERRQVQREHVTLDDAYVRRALLAEGTGQVAVDFYADHGAGSCRQRPGERAAPRANLEEAVAWAGAR